MAAIRTLGFVVVACVALACESNPARQEISQGRAQETEPAPVIAAASSNPKPHFEPGKLPLSAFVTERIAACPANGATVVYVGASWCEPCQRFHRALAAGELDSELANVEFIEYDYDVARDGLIAAGYHAKYIPLFALPKSDGTASGRQIEGGIRGDGAVADILPRLKKLTARR